MPKLKQQEPKKIYWFTSASTSNRKLKKHSGDTVSETEIKEFEIPDYLLERPKKKKK